MEGMVKPPPLHTVVATKSFQRRIKSIGVSEAERDEIYDTYQSDPAYGVIEPGTGGLRKGRIAKERKGKSGGFRVFSFYLDQSNPVFLLWLIAKSEDDSLSKEQKNEFKKALAILKKELRN